MVARKEAGYTEPFLFNATPITLCMGVPSLEYPGIHPTNVIPIGPILLPSPKLSDIDPELDIWLNHPDSEGMFTITFALGSHAILDQRQAEALIKMFGDMMEARSNVRVYAKIMRAATSTYDLRDLGILKEMANRFGAHRFQAVEWMTADPIVLLRTGKVNLSIHHGGSNSYHEALR